MICAKVAPRNCSILSIGKKGPITNQVEVHKYVKEKYEGTRHCRKKTMVKS